MKLNLDDPTTYVPTVKRIAFKFHWRDGISVDDLVGAGLLDLVEGLARLDPEMGWKERHQYALDRIYGSIWSYLSNSDGFRPIARKRNYPGGISDRPARVPLTEGIKDTSPRPDELAEKRLTLWQYLSPLREHERKILGLFLKGLTLAEIGKLLGTSKEHVLRTIRASILAFRRANGG